nr:MAG TPA: hypothetical protein [Caudoviricetes sp.]
MVRERHCGRGLPRPHVHPAFPARLLVVQEEQIVLLFAPFSPIPFNGLGGGMGQTKERFLLLE